jgi:protein-tyrosine-phosphatase
MTNIFKPNVTLNMQTVAVVCRANEVRSRIVEAYLNLALSGCQVRSFGTEVRKSAKVSSEFIATMHNWGLKVTTHAPCNVESGKSFIQSADLVVAADSQIFAIVRDMNRNSVNLTDFALDESHVPIDPIGLTRNAFLENISKVVHCTSRLLDSYTPSSPNNREILAVIPQSARFVPYLKSDGFIIDSSFGGYQSKAQSNLEVIWFAESDFRSGNILNLVRKNFVQYSSKYEFLKPEQVLISSIWKDFVEKVALTGPTEVITQPLGRKNSESWQPYLASRLAHAVKYI